MAYKIKIKKIGKNAYDWEVTGKSGYTNKKVVFAEGVAFVENKKMVKGIAKEYIKENLSHI